MGVVINPESDLGHELAKWEQHHTRLVGDGQNPGNPYVYRPYPKMLYRAQRLPNGQIRCVAAPPNPLHFNDPKDYEREFERTEAFNKACQRIVGDESEHLIAQGQGWCEDIPAAMAQAEREAAAISTAAAEAAYQAARMSERALAEFAAADAASEHHVVDVVGAKRGKSKAVSVRPDGSHAEG